MSGSSRPRGRALAEIDRVGAQRVSRGRRGLLVLVGSGAAERTRRRARRLSAGTFAMPCEMKLRMSRRVTPCAGQQLRRERSSAPAASRRGRRLSAPRRVPRSARGGRPSAARGGRRGSARARAGGRAPIAPAIWSGTRRDPCGAAAGRRRRRRGSSRLRDRARARTAGVRASGACDAARWPHDGRSSE